jgi:hypothetical protein
MIIRIILFKNIFGVQGKYLTNIIEPIYLSTIIISSEENGIEKQEIIN